MLEHDFGVVQGDFVSFRRCFSERGGSCPGGAARALPHSSQQLTDASPGLASETSSYLDQTVAALPMGHPAAHAHAVLRHPVSQSAAALHDHLRGHPPKSTSVTSEHDEQGRQKVSMQMKLGETHHF
ncbi:MAG: hypothetical protein MI919_40720, partial [Holophagales bacterium]|nr:hypothetical protein [Holophagales bacterium]